MLESDAGASDGARTLQALLVSPRLREAAKGGHTAL